MVRQTSSSTKHSASPARFVVILFVGLLAFALIADFFWASSPKFFKSSLSTSVSDKIPNIIVPAKPADDVVSSKPSSPIGEAIKDKRKDATTERVLSATFQDLPAPELKWEKMAAAPVPRLDGAAIQIKNLLYVFAGYGTIDYLCSEKLRCSHRKILGLGLPLA